MAAHNYQNLTFYSGEDPQFTVTMTPPESVAGWDVEFVALTINYSAVRTSTIGAGITVDDASAGVFTVTFAALPVGVYHYFVTRTSPGRRVLASGLIVVSYSPV